MVFLSPSPPLVVYKSLIVHLCLLPLRPPPVHACLQFARVLASDCPDGALAWSAARGPLLQGVLSLAGVCTGVHLLFFVFFA